MKIPVTKPFFGDEEKQIIQQPLETGWVVQGPFVQQFETQFCSFTGSAYSVATTSCTTALHLAVRMLGLKPGDEVIVPAFTWVSTPNVVEYCGATPVFCDIQLNTFNLDASRLHECLTPNTVGIIPVHLFGLCADMKPIMKFAERHGLWVVEDAACGLGGYIEETHAGCFADMGCFSFHPRKSITTGEGGMLTTQNQTHNDHARILREHGATRTDLSRHESSAGFLLPDFPELGYNYRMTDIQGALGVAQMNRAEWILAQRKRLAEFYDTALSKNTMLRTPHVPACYTHGYQGYVCLFAPEEPTPETVAPWNAKRNRLMEELNMIGIQTRQGTHAAALVDYYKHKYKTRPEQFHHAWMAEQLSLTLPLYPQMTQEEQEFVCHSILHSNELHG